jgi:hypothetical protein
MSKYKVLWVASAETPRDYRARQIYANEQGAVCYLEGHYNAKEYDKPGTQDNPALAVIASNSSQKTRDMGRWFCAEISKAFGHPNGGLYVRGPNENGYGNVAYAKGNSLLLEPLFVSDEEQARIAKSPVGIETIATIIFQMIVKFYPNGGLIALSPGHKYKVTSPSDRGAPVHPSVGGWEADLAELYMKRLAELLELHYTGIDPAPPSPAPPVASNITLVGRWEVASSTDNQTTLKRIG